MSSEIRDINLAESGERKIEWVKRQASGGCRRQRKVSSSLRRKRASH